MKICALCGRPADSSHHLVFGSGLRKLADEDSLTIDICNECHTMAVKPKDRIHDNPVAEKLSKMLGQALWEKRYIARQAEMPFDDLEEEAREKFRDRYGKSYL